DGEDDRGREPLRDEARDRSFPKEEKTEDDERNVDERVAQKENVENASRILAEDANELSERWMFLLEPAQLMGLEREERGLESREKARPEDQDRDGEKENGEDRQRHFSLRRRSCNRSPSRRLKR